MTAPVSKLTATAAALTLLSAISVQATPAPTPGPALVRVDAQVLEGRDGMYVIATVTSLFGLELEGDVALKIDGQVVTTESIDTRGEEVIAYRMGRIGGMHVACAELDGMLRINGDATRAAAAEDCSTMIVALHRAQSAPLGATLQADLSPVPNPALRMLDRREQTAIRR
jgi:hypothetical protein